MYHDNHIRRQGILTTIISSSTLHRDNKVIIHYLTVHISRRLPRALGNSLAPNRRQAIIWTNDDQVHRRIYAALGEMSYLSFMIVLTPAEISIRNVSIIYKLQSRYCEGKNVEIWGYPIHKVIYSYKHSNVFIIYVDINIPWSKQACLKADTWILCEVGQYKFRYFWFVKS